MFINKNIELIDGTAMAYINDISAVVISDMHLGYEGTMAKSGIFMPQVNLKQIIKNLDAAMEKRKVEFLIIDGDIKNEFAGVGEAEFDELYKFAEFAKDKKMRLVLIKGNHDNFVERYKEQFKFDIHRQEAKIGNYLFFHGEDMPQKLESAKTLIMGHEHPAISIYSDVGKEERLRCFLYGKYKRKNLLVLPAISYFSNGTPVNTIPKGKLLSPIFKHVNIDEMHAIAIGYGSTMDFGKIKELKKLAKNNLHYQKIT
ncbi:MAG: metallophosphoesterase [Candidatus Marsarchaeota archaeon]|jgi:putative SbcD/Mre11-related phosphoesterase|nr:metallophosphoesterase [Candidatus Marsarchaeota archaeon]